MNARYYDPATGRFVSQDTYTGTPYAPWTQHLYSYCGNNPVNMVDPTGHMPVKPIAVNDGGTTNVVPEHEPTPEPKPEQGPKPEPGPTPGNLAGFSKQYTNRGDSSLRGLPKDVIRERAHDNSLPPEIRNKYRTEEKVNELRNVQKRKSQKRLPPKKKKPKNKAPKFDPGLMPSRLPQWLIQPVDSGEVNTTVIPGPAKMPSNVIISPEVVAPIIILGLGGMLLLGAGGTSSSDDMGYALH